MDHGVSGTPRIINESGRRKTKPEGHSLFWTGESEYTLVALNNNNENTNIGRRNIESLTKTTKTGMTN
jgi:hypothetical protein